jgi:hypothetical protein
MLHGDFTDALLVTSNSFLVLSFPCHGCGDAEGQVKRAVAALHSAGAKIGRLWLDIEGTQYWGAQSSNRAFFEGLVKGCHAAGVAIGVYTSASQWNPIMGSYSGGAAYPLWYAHCTYLTLYFFIPPAWIQLEQPH